VRFSILWSKNKKLKTPFKLLFNSTLEFQPVGLHDAFKLNYKPTPALIETVIILTQGEILTVFSSPKRAQIKGKKIGLFGFIILGVNTLDSQEKAVKPTLT